MMHMTFYWGKSVTILFDSWRTSTWLSYSLSLVALFFVAAFYQYLEDRRIKLKLHTKISKKPSIQTPLLRGATANRSVNKIAIALFFGVNSAIGYMLMLAVMSFNGGVIIAVCLGFSVGYLIWRIGDEEEDDLLATENPCACA